MWFWWLFCIFGIFTGLSPPLVFQKFFTPPGKISLQTNWKVETFRHIKSCDGNKKEPKLNFKCKLCELKFADRDERWDTITIWISEWNGVQMAKVGNAGFWNGPLSSGALNLGYWYSRGYAIYSIGSTPITKVIE